MRSGAKTMIHKMAFLTALTLAACTGEADDVEDCEDEIRREFAAN